MKQEFSYKTRGVCSRRISGIIEDGILAKVEFESGCDGNSKGLSRLAEGMPVLDVIQRLKGIRCEAKDTSCPDQLAKALEAFITKKGK